MFDSTLESIAFILVVFVLLPMGIAAIRIKMEEETPKVQPVAPKMSKPAAEMPPMEELLKLEIFHDIDMQLMDMSDLEKHTGKGGQDAYIACKGLVFDVTKNEVYKGEGGYNCFAGTDCTVALGTM